MFFLTKSKITMSACWFAFEQALLGKSDSGFNIYKTTTKQQH